MISCILNLLLPILNNKVYHLKNFIFKAEDITHDFQIVIFKEIEVDIKVLSFMGNPVSGANQHECENILNLLNVLSCIAKIRAVPESSMRFFA